MKKNIIKQIVLMVFMFVMIIVVFVSFSWFSLSKIVIGGKIYNDIIESKDIIADILPPPLYIVESYLNSFQIATEKDSKILELLIGRAEQLKKDYFDRQKYWETSLPQGEFKTLFLVESAKYATTFFKVRDEELVPAVKNGQFELAQNIVLKSLKESYDSHRKVIDSVVSASVDTNTQREAKAKLSIKHTNLLMIISWILAIVIIIFYLIFVIRNILKISQNILQKVMSIADASNEVNQGNQDLAERTQEQASSLEEAAATLEQITSTIKQTADNAQKAAQFSQNILKGTEASNHLSITVQKAMDDITSSSNKISDIVTMVEEIAFQTNILAINAAVEAAKAGELGKGFAVVAIEVRDLAQRADMAAKEIKNLIAISIEKVHNGSKLVKQNAESLVKISGEINQSVDIVSEISSSTREQSTAVEQINTAISSLDSTTQQNSTLVEELASSSQNLLEVAKKIKLTLQESLTLKRNQ